MLPPSQYPRQRFIVALTLASGVPLALVQGLIVGASNDGWLQALMAAGALMLPPIFIAFYLLGEASPRALGLVIAYAGLFTLASGALFSALLAFVATELGGRTTFALILVAVVAPYVVLGVAATRTAKELYGVAATRETLPQSLWVILLYLTALAISSVIAGALNQITSAMRP
jgi:hypothetical protein